MQFFLIWLCKNVQQQKLQKSEKFFVSIHASNFDLQTKAKSFKALESPD